MTDTAPRRLPQMAAPPRRSVNPGLTPNARTATRRPRRPRTIEIRDYVAFCRRILRAASRRVAAGDPEALPLLLELADETEQLVRAGVLGLRKTRSWAEIASQVPSPDGQGHITRQAAQQRWGVPDEPAEGTTTENGDSPCAST